ncbi:hypothetical protein C2134_12530 [Chromobacterium sinusclupearum]|uniref:Uncharacterized protein n=2 Tax=Chromobacterium sinusclupearum TaxID=2077146 RepID=A0A2K4MMI6_9NEIS|nr:hypothetical protein C2134_12530 [Chromobacterium sinusclupearum]
MYNFKRGNVMTRLYGIENLADELNHALNMIRRGRLTVSEAQQLTRSIHEVSLTEDLFPNETPIADKVAAQLLIIQQLEREFDLACERGALPGDKLGEIPCLNGVLQRALEESVGPLYGSAR